MFRHFKVNITNFCKDYHIFYSSMAQSCTSEETKGLLERARRIIPPLEFSKHKGQAGRVGVIGGSLEYTGAPYFAAISALKAGADIVHVFCQQAAAPVIKSYSPELIVHPLLDSEHASSQITPWLDRLHVLVIGPGLGRDKNVLDTVAELINFCREAHKPIVIDADGLHLISEHKELLKEFKNVILTPNAIEFTRLFGNESEKFFNNISQLGNDVVVLEKGMNDKVYLPGSNKVSLLPAGGSARRCGGQGDCLSGVLAVFYHWALKSSDPSPAFIAAFAAGFLVKSCNERAFKKYGRSTICSNMIEEIHEVLREFFERC